MTKDELKYKLKLAQEDMSRAARECNELEQDLKFAEVDFEDYAVTVEQLEKQLANMGG